MQKNKGISLIVLVITIIVMIILAGAIILTLNNSGIIDKASDAVQQTDLATVKELAQMALAEAYLQTDKSQGALETYVLAKLGEEIGDKYVIEVTTKGVNVVLKGPWVQTKETITNGKITINVGDKINYIATGTDYSGEWKVLGVSEYGELLIMSNGDVTRHYIGYSSTTDSAKQLSETQNAWLNASEKLNTICKVYGNGIGATGARSVTIEDIDKILGYNPKTAKYGEGELYKYGNEVTYSYNGTLKPAYKSANGETGILKTDHNIGFYFYDGTEFIHVNDLTEGANGKKFATLKSDYYAYEVGEITFTNKALLMLFGEYDTKKSEYPNTYWLASTCTWLTDSVAWFGVRRVHNGQVGRCNLWHSHGLNNGFQYGVRAVVTLATNVVISENAAGDLNINI